MLRTFIVENGMRLLFLARFSLRRIAKPISVSVRAIVHADHSQILLVQHTYVAGLYLPGGGIKLGEDAHEAIVRELKEEIGLSEMDVRSCELIGIYLNEFGGGSDHIILFEVKAELQRLKEICEASGGDDMEIACAVLANLDDLPHSLVSGSKRRILNWVRNQSEMFCGRW